MQRDDRKRPQSIALRSRGIAQGSCDHGVSGQRTVFRIFALKMDDCAKWYFARLSELLHGSRFNNL
jgi:hypothetical protein